MALEVDLRAAGPIALNVRFRVEPGQITALVGPSGAGKSTVLRAIAGLWRVDHARIVVGGQIWQDSDAGVMRPTRARRLGMVFQSYALFPHLTAAQNVALALDHLPKPARAAAALGLLDQVNLAGVADRRPDTLSGGQQQRVALARALARAPQVLLLDEPFSAVDRPTRADLYREIGAMRGRLQMPVVLVTHDLDEAQLLADRIVVLQGGAMLHQGTVAEVLVDPAAVRALGLSEAGSLIPAVVAAHEVGGLTRLTISAGSVLVPRLEAMPGDPLHLRVLAQDVILARQCPEGLSALNVLPAVVVAVRLGDGPGALVELQLGHDRLLARITRRSVTALNLAPGVACFAIVKSLSSTRVIAGPTG